MTFREFMRENGYELQTTFWEDFSIADRFGLSAIQDTFKRKHSINSPFHSKNVILLL